MSWEMVSGISGLISALVAIISLFQIKPFMSTPQKSDKEQLTEKYFSYLLACSGWVLCVLSWAWVTDEYGAFVTDREMKEFIGIALSLPAVILFVHGFKCINTKII